MELEVGLTKCQETKMTPACLNLKADKPKHMDKATLPHRFQFMATQRSLLLSRQEGDEVQTQVCPTKATAHLSQEKLLDTITSPVNKALSCNSHNNPMRKV